MCLFYEIFEFGMLFGVISIAGMYSIIRSILPLDDDCELPRIMDTKEDEDEEFLDALNGNDHLSIPFNIVGCRLNTFSEIIKETVHTPEKKLTGLEHLTKREVAKKLPTELQMDHSEQSFLYSLEITNHENVTRLLLETVHMLQIKVDDMQLGNDEKLKRKRELRGLKDGMESFRNDVKTLNTTIDDFRDRITSAERAVENPIDNDLGVAVLDWPSW